MAFQFDHVGMIRISTSGDDVLLKALDAGASDVEEENGESIVYTDLNDLAKVRDALRANNLDITEAELTYVPNNSVEISDNSTAGKIMRLMEALEDIDDVTNTYVNFEISDDIVL